VTDLVVRKIPWEFDASVPFMWQPANPHFGLACNAFTFIAVAFERYIVLALRQAQDKLNEDPDVAAEAELFLRPLFHAVPTSQLLTTVWRLMLTQTPHYDPADQPLPGWADTWMREYKRGSDMTTFYGTPPDGGPTTER
jgi:hypothetical protein